MSLKQSQALGELAEVLYNFLPGSGNPKWKGHVSFKSVADRVGVADCWQPGSKLPMIAHLLRETLRKNPARFEPLMIEIMNAGMIYRRKSGNPVSPSEVDKINGLLMDAGFKFPALWDPEFRGSLALDTDARASMRLKDERARERIEAEQVEQRVQGLQELEREFFRLAALADRQAAGLLFEGLLNRLFTYFDLAPRRPFRIVGEQLDGSFELDHETYLVEAKWEAAPLAEQPLLTFRGKIEGKSQFTRGIFVALNGVSQQAKDAIVRGRQPTFFVVDGHDLSMILGGQAPLPNFLRRRMRLLAEEGRVFVPFGDLESGSRRSG